jgi:tRNA U34 5-methylaminomethyl-2-thiouridine-forming methyltransferase MnmC
MSKNINQVAKVVKTEDGSSTLYIEEMDETYHSTNGALQESLHIFINEGLRNVKSESVKILEIGFGTGLNAIMTLVNKENRNVEYHTLEPFPLGEKLISELDFPSFLDPEFHGEFNLLHQLSWGVLHEVGGMKFQKYEITLQDFEINEQFDVIYFDAFAPSKQADVWALENLEKCFKLLNIGGFLVTYCASGQFKRNLKECGFVLEHPPGPKGKREMTKAIKK